MEMYKFFELANNHHPTIKRIAIAKIKTHKKYCRL